jgi:hypothetical protein
MERRNRILNTITDWLFPVGSTVAALFAIWGLARIDHVLAWIVRM